ncbi:MAG: B12-binding domain-containing radical SAM protein [Proteobacteria bacterium]|nr:B12-binding domain-containing radical SAM protein [Pseudomonadota bacterium]
MGKDIIFVNPPYERVAPGYEFIKHIANNSPSLGLLHLAAEVREHGYEASIIESDIFDYSPKAVAEKIIKQAPAYVGITLFTVGVWNAVTIAKLIKKALPNTIIIVGGPHISSMGSETIERFKEFDYAVNGEGEKTLMELLTAIENGTPMNEVPGILFRDGPFVKTTPGNPINRVLDELPYPAWDLLPDFPNAYKPAIYDFPRGPVATIAASRGCPFQCRFCDTSTFGNRVRHYSPEKVFDMMKHLNEKYGVRHIMFVDDLFLASKVRVTELCNMLLESDLKMTWSCTARVDTVKPGVLKLMRKAGCWEISFGLESGSNEMLKKMDKLAEVEKSEQAVKWTADAGIRTKGLFMLGYPGETRETIDMTKDFVKRIPMTIMNLTKFTPYPGSPIYRDLYGTNIRDDHWEKMNGMNFVWSPEGFTAEELDREYQEVLTSFYKRRQVGHHYLKMTLQHPNHMARLLRFGAGFVAAKARSLISGRKGLLIKSDEKNLDRVN